MFQKTKRVVFWTLAGVHCPHIGKHCAVNHYCRFTPDTYIGAHANFNGMRIQGAGKVVIGQYFHSGSECLIITSNHNYDGGKAIPYDNTYITKDVIIGDFVWIGSRVIILAGVNIGRGAVIQAGSVVTDDIPEFSVAGGVPARVFKMRDIAHFEALYKEGKFH